jgi:hypothetical protein
VGAVSSTTKLELALSAIRANAVKTASAGLQQGALYVAVGFVVGMEPGGVETHPVTRGCLNDLKSNDMK